MMSTLHFLVTLSALSVLPFNPCETRYAQTTQGFQFNTDKTLNCKLLLGAYEGHQMGGKFIIQNLNEI